jgi:hypothetical protein
MGFPSLLLLCNDNLSPCAAAKVVLGKTNRFIHNLNIYGLLVLGSLLPMQAATPNLTASCQEADAYRCHTRDKVEVFKAAPKKVQISGLSTGCDR